MHLFSHEKQIKTSSQALPTDRQTDTNLDKALFGFSRIWNVQVRESLTFLSNVQLDKLPRITGITIKR